LHVESGTCCRCGVACLSWRQPGSSSRHLCRWRRYLGRNGVKYRLACVDAVEIDDICGIEARDEIR
jgi:hypothetical protein